MMYCPYRKNYLKQNVVSVDYLNEELGSFNTQTGTKAKIETFSKCYKEECVAWGNNTCQFNREFIS